MNDEAEKTSSRRERKKREHRDRLRRAAHQLFARRGYDATTVDEITRRADLAKGTFFNFFPSKRAVLESYYQDLDARFFEALHGLDPRRPEASLRGYFRMAERLLRQEGRLAEVLYRAIAAEPDLGVMDRQSGDAARCGMAEFFRKASACNSLRADFDADLAAQVVTDMWSATVVEWFESRRTFSLSGILAAKCRLLFVGLALPSAPAPNPGLSRRK